jgi:oligoribonuclease
VHFDRGFIERYAPAAAELLGYRHVDASVVMELARRVWPEAYMSKKEDKDLTHRAMPDIEASIAMTKHYAAALAPKRQVPLIDTALDVVDAVCDADIAKLPDDVVKARMAYQFPQPASGAV